MRTTIWLKLHFSSLCLAARLISMALVPASSMPIHDSSFAPEESVITAYTITPVQEKQFGATPNEVSPFWTEWKEQRLSHARLSVINEPFSPATDPFDAQTLVYTAYGEKGVYFLFDIIDDDYPGPVHGADSWALDVAEVVIDPSPPSKLFRKPDLHFCDTSATGRGTTRNMVQIQYSCGGGKAPQSIGINYFEEPAKGCGKFAHTVTLEEAVKRYGIVVRLIPVNSMRRLQEWFIPYRWFGHPGPDSRPTPGSRSALVINYNDTDTNEVMDRGPEKLTWGGRGSPFGQRDAWGTLLYGPSLMEVVSQQYLAHPDPQRPRGNPSGPRTPPMGWNPWNAFGTKVNETIVRESADSMKSKGLLEAGYTYINIDGGGKYPSGYRALADYVHAKGFKFGLYGNHLKMYDIIGKEDSTARAWAACSVDYVKYDAYTVALSHPTWNAFSRALAAASPRPIVYSIHYEGENADTSLPGLAHLWRTGPDILVGIGTEKPSFRKVMRNALLNEKFSGLSGPGAWSDPDFLMIGLPNGMTHEEEKTQFSLWAIAAAPLLIGCDIRTIGDSSLSVLLNKEVIAVNQDVLGYQGRLHNHSGSRDVTLWIKQMNDGGKVILFVNAGNRVREVSVTWSEMGIGQPIRARNLWTHQDVKVSRDAFRTTVPIHGSVMIRVWEGK